MPADLGLLLQDVEVVAFDGDDTLWHSENLFAMTEEKFIDLVSGYVPETDVKDRLFRTEMKNLGIFGYGTKGFIISMIETALELTGERISGADIQKIIALGKDMLEHPVEVLPGVPETLAAMAGRYRLLVITKGDLFDQESKIARSGLAEHFWKIEIVSEKDQATYRDILMRHEIQPERFLMVGNSVRSDILPVVELGAKAVYVPYDITWQHETVELDPARYDGRVARLETLATLALAL